MNTQKLIVSGMNCQHCVMALKKELTDAGLTVLNAGIGFAEISVTDTTPGFEKLAETVAEAGYQLTSVEPLN